MLPYVLSDYSLVPRLPSICVQVLLVMTLNSMQHKWREVFPLMLHAERSLGMRMCRLHIVCTLYKVTKVKVCNQPHSGDYWLQSGSNYAVQVYCDMERVCGCGGEGGWMRVADIDMTRHKENCPAGFRLVTSSGKRMCGNTGVGCVATAFSSRGVEYSRVCGRVIGYQFGRVNAFAAYHQRTHTTLGSPFLDGVVLTYGSPRCHIWSFAAAISQTNSGVTGCSCFSAAVPGATPSFVHSDYFCDSGYQYSTQTPLDYLVHEPLWDGAGCVQGTCCEFNSPPWFCKDLPQSTSDDIELRICGNDGINNEDTPIERVEIYVQ